MKSEEKLGAEKSQSRNNEGLTFGKESRNGEKGRDLRRIEELEIPGFKDCLDVRAKGILDEVQACDLNYCV